jgi:spore coat polysaccharide biosynthesis protein SpsF
MDRQKIERPVAIIQARMGSTRLPGKVLMPLLGKPMLWHIVKRLRWVDNLRITVATSDSDTDIPIRNFCINEDIPCFAGSENDVLDRFYRAACCFSADPIIRITADCPFVDPEIITKLLLLYADGDYDHVGVAAGAGAVILDGGRYPNGLDAECFSFEALQRAWENAVEQSDREHVTPYMWRISGRFRIGALKADKDYSSLRWTVDYEEDFHLVSLIYEKLYRDDRPFVMADILDLLRKRPDLVKINQTYIGKEGYERVWKV